MTLLIVVFTQNKRCNIIPLINKIIKIIQNGLFKKYAIKKEIIIVPTKSKIAILNNLVECNPSFGFPNESLYLHNEFIYDKRYFS